MKRQLQRPIAVLLLLAFVAALFSGCADAAPSSGQTAGSAPSSSKTPEAPQGDEAQPDWYLDFSSIDPAEPPSPTKQVLYLEGSWYEMGYQYAQQAPEALLRILLYAGGNAVMESYGGPEGLLADEAIAQRVENIRQSAPELVEVWQGMADGLGVDLAWIVLSECRVQPAGCSHMSAWGDATSDGAMVCGSNLDLAADDTLYRPAVIARPEGGNAFISINGFSYSVAVMNDKGVVAMASRGQNAGEGDMTNDGIQGTISGVLVAAKANNAKEALDLYVGQYGASNGDNFHCVDPQTAYLVEHTSAKDFVRAGEENEYGYPVYGQGDYIVASNGFLGDIMQDSLETFWLDNLPRYWTEERYILESYGDVNINTISNALSSTRTYIPENWEQWLEENGVTWFVGDERQNVGEGKVYNWNGETGWIDFDWDPAGVGLWAPENRTIDYGPTTRTICEPENRNMYIMVGCRNTINAKHPDATGTYVKLHLGEDMASTNEEAATWAKYMIFYASRDVDRAGGEDKQRVEYLDMAKQARFEGLNYTSLARSSLDPDEQRLYYGKATSAYGRAQCYAQMAMDDPTQIPLDGNTQYFMG